MKIECKAIDQDRINISKQITKYIIFNSIKEEENYKNMVKEESEHNSGKNKREECNIVGNKQLLLNKYNVDYSQDYIISEYNLIKYLIIETIQCLIFVLLIYCFFSEYNDYVFIFLILILIIDITDLLIMINFMLKLGCAIYFLVSATMYNFIWYAIKLLLDFYLFIITTKICYLCTWFRFVEDMISYLYINILICVGLEVALEKEPEAETCTEDSEYSKIEDRSQ